MPTDEPFEGYSAEQLVLLLTEVYGLVSGPAWWRRSLLEVLVRELKYRVNPYDRCVLTLDAEAKNAEALTEGIILIEVDDLYETGSQRQRRNMEWLASKLRFGKSVNLREEHNGTSYAGKRLWQGKDFSYYLTMDDYVQNRLKPVNFTRQLWKKDSMEVQLNDAEQAQLRGTIASINWAAREGRPDASAAASILAAAFPKPLLHHALEANKVVARLKAHSVTIKIHSLPEADLRHVLVSDSAFDPSGRTKPQHGWILGVTTPDLNLGKEAPVSLLSWRSRRLRRKAGSTMLSESISLASALGSLERQVAFFKSIRFSRFNPRTLAEREEEPECTLRGKASVIASEDELYTDPDSVCIVDAKSLYDASNTEQAVGEDDRSALELALIQDSMSKVRGRIRWIPHNSNPADMLTKLTGAHEEPMLKLLKTHSLKIQKEAEVLGEGKQSLHRKKHRGLTAEDFLGAENLKKGL